jgi:hypothetical protein
LTNGRFDTSSVYVFERIPFASTEYCVFEPMSKRRKANTPLESAVIGRCVHAVESAGRTSSSTRSDWKPRRFAEIIWSPPFATVAFPGSTEMLNSVEAASPRHGTATSLRPFLSAGGPNMVSSIAAPSTAARIPPFIFSSPASIALPSPARRTRSSAVRVNRSISAGDRIGMLAARALFCISTAVMTLALSDRSCSSR